MPQHRQNLVARIQRLAGIDPIADYDESFFAPTGNDQSVQFLLKNLAPELLELDPVDAHGFLCTDLSQALGFELTLDESGLFAEGRFEPKKGPAAQVVLDLSDPLLVWAHFLGEQRQIARLNAQICARPELPPARLGSKALWELKSRWSALEEIHLNFEQSARLFKAPQSLKAQFKGPSAAGLLKALSAAQPQLVHLTNLAGRTADAPNAWIALNEQACLSGRGLKTQAFLEHAQAVAQALSDRYAPFLAPRWPRPESLGQGWFQMQGEALIAQADHPVDLIEPLLKQLSTGAKPLDLVGTPERLAPELWDLILTDGRGARLGLQVAPDRLRARLDGRASLALLDRLEAYLAAHISAGQRFVPEEA